MPLTVFLSSDGAVNRTETPDFSGRYRARAQAAYISRSSPPLAFTNFGSIRLSQQYAEVVQSGQGNIERLSQQYVEVVQSGQANVFRLSQMYLEVVMSPNQTTPPGNLPLPVWVGYGNTWTALEVVAY